ncbi:MAG TPA: alcohol dehydrogenase catalytic domain-containing protein [Mycobacteriales bacterium]|nr:alcohol dehydrogenase catalytic domain-containing protein [Mycobacteriales bacterium]
MSLPGLVWRGGTEVAVQDVPRPADRDGWARVDVAYAGLCGTDLHICAGEHSRAKPGLVIGHEFVGRLSAAFGDLAAGQPVFVNPMIHCGECDACRRGLIHVCRQLTSVGIDYPGAACPEVVVPGYGLYPLPASLALNAAALIEPLSVGVRAIHRSGVRLGDRVHVIGAGPIGCIIGILAGLAGAVVTVSEPSPTRREMAEALGLATVDAADPEPSADVVFDATGIPAVAPTIAQWVRPGGRVTLVGAYPPAPQAVELLAFMFGELTLVGTRIYTRADILAAIDLVAGQRVDVASLVTREIPLSDGAAAIDQLRAGTAMKLLLNPTA